MHGGFDYKVGYFNGHYSKNKCGDYQMDFYPIPVISVKKICDIEINSDGLSISTKLTKEKAIHFDYNLLSEYAFEVYGVDDYLSDYYVKGDSIEKMIENIKKADEEHIGFSFSFDMNFNGDKILKFIRFLCSNGFFY